MPEDCVFSRMAPRYRSVHPHSIFVVPLRAGFLFVLVVEDRRFDVINHIVRNIEKFHLRLLRIQFF